MQFSALEQEPYSARVQNELWTFSTHHLHLFLQLHVGVLVCLGYCVQIIDGESVKEIGQD